VSPIAPFAPGTFSTTTLAERRVLREGAAQNIRLLPAGNETMSRTGLAA